jgi:cell division protein FtsQ
LTPPAAVSVDPRIRARRIAVRRDEGRQRLRRLLVLLGVLGALAALTAAAFSPLLDVDTVRVEGADRSGAETVLAVADVGTGEAMVTVDAGRVSDRVRRLPWVADVSVERDWPGTVIVRVTERQAAAAVGAGEGAWLLLDADGTALERVTGRAPGVPVVEGLDATAAPGEEVGGAAGALALVAALPPSLEGRVTAVSSDRGALELTIALPDGTSATVDLGTPTAIEAKLLSLVTVLEQVDLAGLARIDLRVHDAPVLTRR